MLTKDSTDCINYVVDIILKKKFFVCCISVTGSILYCQVKRSSNICMPFNSANKCIYMYFIVHCSLLYYCHAWSLHTCTVHVVMQLTVLSVCTLELWKHLDIETVKPMHGKGVEFKINC